MKFIHIKIILSLMQLVILVSSSPMETKAASEELFKFYENELNTMAQNFGEKAKILSEKLLQDKSITEVSTTDKNEFKIFINDFLQDYQHFKRFNLYQPLVAIFENITKSKLNNFEERPNSYQDFSQNLEIDHKFKQLMKLHFGIMLDEYELIFIKFIKQQFLPKFQQLKHQLMPQNLKEKTKLLHFIKHLNQCQDYKCFDINLNLLFESLNNEMLLKIALKDFEKIAILVAIRVNNIFKSMLKDPQILELSLNAKQNITNILNEYIHNFESNDDIVKLSTIQQIFSLKYYIYEVHTIEDFKLLTKLYGENTRTITKAKFQMQSKYFIKKLVEFGLPSILKEDIPKEKMDLIHLVKHEIFNVYRENDFKYIDLMY